MKRGRRAMAARKHCADIRVLRQEYYLGTRVESDSVHLTLCDGTQTWRGEVLASALQPPRGTPLSVFREQLIDGLLAGPDDELEIVSTHPSYGATMRWTRIHKDTDGIDMRFQQTMGLALDLVPGQGLQSILSELVHECGSLQSACARHQAHRAELQARLPWPVFALYPCRPTCNLGPTQQAQLQELDSVSAQLEESSSSSTRGKRRAQFLELLNRKKRRISELDEILDRDAQGGDAFGDDISEGRPEYDGDDIDAFEATELPPAAAGGMPGESATAAAAGSAGSGTGSFGAAVAAEGQPRAGLTAEAAVPSGCAEPEAEEEEDFMSLL